MAFIADKQTQDDLNILGKYKTNSLFSLFNGTSTTGGERLLESWFRQPLTDAETINKRSATIAYFASLGLPFPVQASLFDSMTNYLDSSGGGFLIFALRSLRRKALTVLGLKQEYYLAQKGLADTQAALRLVREFVSRLVDSGPDAPFQQESAEMDALLNDPLLGWLANPPGKEASFLAAIRYEHILKQTLKERMGRLIRCLYEVDVYTAAGAYASQRGLTYAHAIPGTENLLQLEEMYHPALPKAIANSVSLRANRNMIFLTGANMAGKSTFMKTFGVCLYLAHMGFPVPAGRMEFSVKEGLYTSINVPDNLHMGYSHFYAEVLRVKKVAEEVASGKKLIVIFDELFKGTNVKDAYDATLAVTEGYASYPNCFYIISTHIVEVGEALASPATNIQFSYMPTVMEGTLPRYTYALQTGISSDRHGMMIIENERILEIIKEKKSPLP